MKEWILVASKAEAKIFSHESSVDPLRWVQTLTNENFRKHEHEFEPDHVDSHADTMTRHFAHSIADVVLSAFQMQVFQKLTVFADPKILGQLKKQMKDTALKSVTEFNRKNIEKASTDEIAHFLG